VKGPCSVAGQFPLTCSNIQGCQQETGVPRWLIPRVRRLHEP